MSTLVIKKLVVKIFKIIHKGITNTYISNIVFYETLILLKDLEVIKLINPVIPLLVIPFLANNTNNQNYKISNMQGMPNMQNIQELIELLESINKVSNNMNRNNYRNGGRNNRNINVRRKNVFEDEDIISRLKNFLNRLNGD